jgi:hypothetical protein
MRYGLTMRRYTKCLLGFVVGAALVFVAAYHLDIAATIVTATATVYIARFTIVLAEVGNRQIKDTRILERAYVSVEPGGIKPFIGQGAMDRIACNIFIHNAGNLPASKLSWVIRRGFSRDPFKKDFPITVPEVGDIIIAPKVKVPKGADAVSKADLDEMTDRAEPDTAWLYVWGRVSYNDGFRGGRWTQFCHRYNLLGAVDNAVPMGNGRYHENGNRTDES